MARNKKWTNEEDDVLIRYVRNHPQNLKKCFMMVSEHLTDAGTPRTPSAVAAHWYTAASKKPDALCFFTASEQHVSRNRKNGEGVESTANIWRRLVRAISSLFE